ncbi:hypothetical protein C1H69_17285 [Billgrantia endophytica]|uniref:Tetratricopeptide repeat-like domain-containing protein n=2 Tax=Billgrantia endophytica TaxID=2033802 RepID=A0A2N7TZA0_9GAMM|nr:hypothetical protein C1H69_17285 [Halomonas endophytica]
MMLLSAPALAATPALTGDIIADLQSLQQRLQQGDADGVKTRSRAQAERLAGGNAADRWARALYLQLAANAEARGGDRVAAAALLREARQIDVVDPAQSDRWLREEAGLRLSAGEVERGAELLADWFERHGGEARDHWRMARAMAELERWQQAATWISRALAENDVMDAGQRRLAETVYQRAGRGDEALALLRSGLDGASDPAAWKRTAALAQQLGDHGQAAAIWEAGWRLGALSGEEELLQLVRLHLAGGTPARAAERLRDALEQEVVADTTEHGRLLAQAWEAARDRELALAAWQAVALKSDEGEDWLRLGQLAHAWGRDEEAVAALERARELGAEQAERWLALTLADDAEVAR